MLPHFPVFEAHFSKTIKPLTKIESRDEKSSITQDYTVSIYFSLFKCEKPLDQE